MAKAKSTWGPSPPQEGAREIISLSLLLSKWAAYTLSLAPSTCGLSLAKRGQSHLPPSWMHNSAFPYFSLQGNHQKRTISTLVFSDWSTSPTWGGKHHVPLTPFLQEDPLPLDSSFERLKSALLALYAFLIFILAYPYPPFNSIHYHNRPKI